MIWSGIAGASSPAPLISGMTELNSERTWLITYDSDRNAAPFHGGVPCVRSATRRTAFANSAGSPLGVDCSGFFALDLGASIQPGVDRLIPSRESARTGPVLTRGTPRAIDRHGGDALRHLAGRAPQDVSSVEEVSSRFGWVVASARNDRSWLGVSIRVRSGITVPAGIRRSGPNRTRFPR